MQFVSLIVEKEKQEACNPFLSDRIFEEIENMSFPPTISLYRKVIQAAAIAAGFILIIFTGVNLGNMIVTSLKGNKEVVVFNDAHIERLDLLISE